MLTQNDCLPLLLAFLCSLFPMGLVISEEVIRLHHSLRSAERRTNIATPFSGLVALWVGACAWALASSSTHFLNAAATPSYLWVVGSFCFSAAMIPLAGALLMTSVSTGPLTTGVVHEYIRLKRLQGRDMRADEPGMVAAAIILSTFAGVGAAAAVYFLISVLALSLRILSAFMIGVAVTAGAVALLAVFCCALLHLLKILDVPGSEDE